MTNGGNGGNGGKCGNGGNGGNGGNSGNVLFRNWHEVAGNIMKCQEMIRQEMSGNCDKKQRPE